MNNFSLEENNDEEISRKVPLDDEETDIQFEEVIDVDKIQKELKLQFGELSLNDMDNAMESEIKDIIMMPTVPNQPQSTRLQIDPKDKKYVVYINYDNIEFMENLSPEDRKNMINKILKEQNEFIIAQRELESKKKLIKHVILACITFSIGFPLMFFFVNKAMEMTMQNYKQAKTNFSKLYQERGRVQQMTVPTDSKH